MNQNAKLRAYITLVVGSLVLAAFVLAVTSCGALKSSATVAGGGAAGAALGSLAGPVGAISGAAVGAAGAHLYGENDELRDGDLIGKDALVEELKRRGERIGQLGAALAAAENPSTFDQIKRSLRWIIGALLLLAAINLFVLPRGRAGITARFEALRSKSPIPFAFGMVWFMVTAIFMALGSAHSNPKDA